MTKNHHLYRGERILVKAVAVEHPCLCRARGRENTEMIQLLAPKNKGECKA